MPERYPKILRELDPSKGIPVDFSALHPVTRRKLQDYENFLGIEWTAAYKFPVGRTSYRFGFPGTPEAVPTTAAVHSYLIMGKGPQGEDVRYVRRETQHEMAGQTLIYFDGKRVREALLRRQIEGAGLGDIPLPDAARMITQFYSDRPPVRVPGEFRIVPREELPAPDRETLEEFETYLQVRWGQPRMVEDPRFRRIGQSVEFVRLEGSLPDGETIQYRSSFKSGGRGDSAVIYKGKEYSPYQILSHFKRHNSIADSLGRDWEFLGRSTIGVLEDLDTAIISRFRGPRGERIEVSTGVGPTTIVVDGRILSGEDVSLLTTSNWQPPSGGSYQHLEDRLEFARRSRDWEQRQMELRRGQPRRTGGPDYYERYLRPLEKPGMLYHVTPRENVQDILREGLSRRIATGEHWMAPLQHVSGTYLTGRGEAPSILEIDIGLLDPSKIQRQGEVTTYEGTIPPGAIRELNWIVDYPEPGDPRG